MSVEEFEAIAVSPRERTVARLYRLYRDEFVRMDLNDFDDFIFESVRLLRDDQQMRRRWQAKYTCVLVDEYQDIEPAQERLVQTLAAPEDVLFAVGDEDQCLYAWRRASVERVIELDQTYPGLTRFALSRNYRCPESVVQASRSLIAHNVKRFAKSIEGARSDRGVITLAAASDREAQGAHVARLVSGKGQGEVVNLARTTTVLADIAVGLAQAGVRFFGPERIKREAGDSSVLLSYLRLLGRPSAAREQDVEAVFRVPNRYLPDQAALNVASGLRQGMSFAQAIDRLRIRDAWRIPKLSQGARLL